MSRPASAGYRPLAALLACFLALLTVIPSSARPTDIMLPARGISDVKELEAFLDQAIEQQLDAHQIPGATVSVVKDGRLFFAKGYGFADLEQQKPVVADVTLFRIGSTSKLFTWTAVMQLVEQGKLDIDADVNVYLKDFQVPATYPQPVTLRHLMTHSAGFEDQIQYEYVREPGTPLPLGEFLARHMPARVRPPGAVTAYSNYGTNLAGYIVASVSGMPFEGYVEENIFQPLGMAHSSFRQPLPPGLAADMATGYSVTWNGSLHREPFQVINSTPAGAMSSTAADMARFMIAHLQDGRYGDIRILQAETARQMHRRQFANDARLDGFTLGFFDVLQNQQRILEHGGALPPFYTMLALLPEQQLGIFISYNGAAGGEAVTETMQEFMDHYYPVESEAVEGMVGETGPDLPGKGEESAGRGENIARFAGWYRITRFNYTRIDRAFYLGGMGFGSVAGNPDGTLALDFGTPRGRLASRFVQVEPLVFQEIDGAEKLVFKQGAGGKITYLLINSMPHCGFEKIGWSESAWLSQVVLLACLVIFASAWLAMAGNLVWKRRSPDLPRRIAFGTVLLAGLLLAGYAFQAQALIYGGSPWLKALMGLSLLMPILAILLALLAAHAWVRRRWGAPARIHYSLVALAMIAFVWFLNEWNLLGFQANP